MVGQHFVWVRGEDGLWDVRAERGYITSKRIDVNDGLVITNASSMPTEVQGRLRPRAAAPSAPKVDAAAYKDLWQQAVLEANAKRYGAPGERARNGAQS